MTGIIVSLSIIGTVMVGAIAFFGYKLYEQSKKIETLSKAVVALIHDTGCVEVIDLGKKSSTDFNFPNTDGF